MSMFLTPIVLIGWTLHEHNSVNVGSKWKATCMVSDTRGFDCRRLYGLQVHCTLPTLIYFVHDFHFVWSPISKQYPKAKGCGKAIYKEHKFDQRKRYKNRTDCVSAVKSWLMRKGRREKGREGHTTHARCPFCRHILQRSIAQVQT